MTPDLAHNALRSKIELEAGHQQGRLGTSPLQRSTNRLMKIFHIRRNIAGWTAPRPSRPTLSLQRAPPCQPPLTRSPRPPKENSLFPSPATLATPRRTFSRPPAQSTSGRERPSSFRPPPHQQGRREPPRGEPSACPFTPLGCFAPLRLPRNLRKR